MASEHLLRSPHKIREADYIDMDCDAWWYEEEKGICVVIGDGVGQFYIRWPVLRNALKRKEQSP